MEFRPSRFEILPSVVKNLLIINVLCFLAQKTLDGPTAAFSIEDMFALHAWQSELFKPWQLLTHMFLHGNLSHIFFNMLALWMFGSVLENVWGSRRFLIFYLVCGLGAALMHLLFLSYEMIPMVRDYGAVLQEHASGNTGTHEALGRFIQKYPVFVREDMLLQYLQQGAIQGGDYTHYVKQVGEYYYNSLNGATLGASGAKWFVLFYGALELYEGIRNSAGDNVAHWAHIGGAIVGLLIVITWNKGKKHFY
jgi:membrane associated rhomboid family serine protease